ncbi:Mu transposase C-terminal domain-containing protein [Rhizobium sullae]|uniref:Mu transposase C-terminal domain-containing protein n=1 Tax=Rhizobium sullae TaxID=50338 RepID=UPI001FD807F3|nr:Mu transposase C-terminal domain-containing protein [Rhizobium sullae]
MRELERYIALDIVGSYHQSIHSSLGRPPIAVWREHEARFRCDCRRIECVSGWRSCPNRSAHCGQTGIHLLGLRYWPPKLSTDVGRSNRRLLVKYDPRHMARIFVRRPSGNFVEARYADLTLPSVTLHEAVAARRALLAKGRQEINTRAIVGTAIAQRELVDAATRKTAAVRRGGRKAQNERGWPLSLSLDCSFLDEPAVPALAKHLRG